MALIVILAALSLQWFTGVKYSLKDYDWFTPYISFLRTHLEKSGVWQGYYGLAVIVLPVVLLIGIAHSIANNGFFHLFEFIVSTALLWYYIDARNIEELLSAYFSGNDDDAVVKAFIGTPSPKTKGGVARKVSSTIFVNSLNQLFAYIFWFLVLGPIGIGVYFVVSIVALGDIKDIQMFAEHAKKVKGLLDWIPVRLIGLTFALMGSFSTVFVYWMKNLLAGIDNAEELVVNYGLTALEVNPRESKDSDNNEGRAAAKLVFRSVIVWLVLLATLTVARVF